MKETKLQVVLIRGDDLPSNPNTAKMDGFDTVDAMVEFELGAVKHQSKVIKGTLSPDWQGQVFKFKNFDPNTDRLKVNVWDNGQQSTILGEAFVSLEELPCNYSLELELKLQYKGVPTKGIIKIQVTAEEFGIDTQLYTKNDLIHRVIATFHSSKDKLTNAIVCFETGEIYYGLKDAIEKEKNKPQCKQCMTLLVFPGRYMIRGTIRLTGVPPMIYLFGVALGPNDDVLIEAYKNKDFMFQVDPPESNAVATSSGFKLDIQLNNIRFDKNAKFLLARTKGIMIRANMSEFGKIYRENPDTEKLKEKNIKSKPEELADGNNLHETYDPPHTSSSLSTFASMYYVTIFRSDYDLRSKKT